MKCCWRSFAVIAVVLAIGQAVAAPVYTVTLPAGVTNTLAQAFDNGYVTSDPAETVSLSGLYAAADLRVAGAGRLEINADLKSAGYTGEVHVVSGARLRITANGALGDTAHGTFVADGATLENECLDTSDINKLDFAGEQLSFAGTGTDGLGALVAMTTTKQERNGVWGGTKLTMTGDATILTYSGYQDFPCNNKNNSLNMNFHTLTVCGVLTKNGQDVLKPTGVCMRPIVTNPGHIVVTNCQISINDMADLGGGATNRIVLTEKGELELYSSTVAGRKKWTVFVQEDNVVSPPLKTSAFGAVWDGPIVYQGGEKLSISSQNTSTNTTIFAGPMTVQKPLLIADGMAAAKNPGHPTLVLKSSENDFKGGVTFQNIDVKLAANGAVAASCVTCMVKSTTGYPTSNVTFEPTETYTLPVLTASGPVNVQAGTGSFTGLFKEDAGTLTHVTGLTTPFIDLKSGTYKKGLLADDFYPTVAGLHYGFDTNFTGWSSGTRSANRVYYYPDDPTVTNKVVFDFADLKVAKGSPNGTGTYYEGYLWNGESTNVTWRFGVYCRTLTKLKINGTTVIDKQTFAIGVSFGNAVLKPGANAFDMRIGSENNWATQPTVEPQNSTVWTKEDCFLYCTTSSTSTNRADFCELVDPGDGSLLRRYVEGAPALVAEQTAWSNKVDAVVATVTAAEGTTIDVSGLPMSVATLNGLPTVVSTQAVANVTGSFRVTGAWNVDGTRVMAGKRLASGPTLIFDEGAVCRVANSRALARAGAVTLATSETAIVGMPRVVGTDDRQFEVTKSDDGHTLSIRYLGKGVILVVR